MTANPVSFAPPAVSARLAAVLAAVLTLGLFLPAAGPAVSNALTSVIVREAASGDAAERLVQANGGTITQDLSIIDGFAADVPASAVARLASNPAIASVTPDAALQLQGTYAPAADSSSMPSVGRLIGANAYWSAGFTGSGVDVAIIDSGVSPVLGLNGDNKVVRGPDLSFESQAPNLRYLDTFGHGTFMAGLIAAHEPGSPVNPGQQTSGYAGIAPGARIISIKVADARGATDVSQVIAAIDWVIQHRRDNGMNIRVLNLSFGTYSSQPYALDPLAFAAEAAWHAGIFVVVSAGNSAPPSGRLMNPAVDPFVMAVGASDPAGTIPVKDDVLLASSARGDGIRNPDLVAPGRSIQGLRVPGSYVDLTFPGGRISDRYFRGSGTSQAAAIVSGAAALVIQQRPTIKPDALKALLTSTASRLPAADGRGQGAGMVNLAAAVSTKTPLATQLFARSTGTGTLEGARGVYHLVINGVVLDGERDIFGQPFNSAAIAAATLTGTTWSGGTWNGSVWTGPGWAGNEWSTVEWTGTTWAGNEWSASEWSGNEWSGSEWSGSEWSGSEWSASEWSASEWSGSEWSSALWQSASWSSGQ